MGRFGGRWGGLWMFGRYFTMSILFLTLTINPCYAARGLMRIPTQGQLDKYCIAVRLKIDNDIHYFAYTSIKSFDSTGLIIIYGKNKDKENVIPRDQILNYDECYKRYTELVIELGAR